MKKIIFVMAVLCFGMVGLTQAADITVELLAGQDWLVGHVHAWTDAESLYVEYLLDVELDIGLDCIEDLELMEAHLHVAYVSPQKPEWPITGSGNPKVGKFEYSGEPLVSGGTLEIALGDIPGTLGDTIYIGAHAVVGYDNGYCDICDELIEDTVDLNIDKPGLDSYFDVTIDGETYPAWCVDDNHAMNLFGPPPNSYPELVYPFDLFGVRRYAATCAEGFYPLPSYLTTGHGTLGGIDREENLELVLWILNEWHQYHPAGWTVADIQQVIWHLLESEGEVPLIDDAGEGKTKAIQEAILAAAEAAEILPPGCCDYVGVILAPPILENPDDWDIYPGDGIPDDRIRQLAIMLVPAPCCFDETAWGAGSGFPGKQWATYFSVVTAAD